MIDPIHYAVAGFGIVAKDIKIAAVLSVKGSVGLL